MTRRKPKLVRLPKPKVSGDTTFIETLVWALSQARAGRVTGYAAVFMVECEDGVERSNEVASILEWEGAQATALQLLGCIRLMERGFIDRNWPEGD